MSALKEVVLSQKRDLEIALKERYVERSAQPGAFTDYLIRVVIGPRRSGKSFFAEHWLNKNGSVAYLNFDDERLVKNPNLDELLATVDLVYGPTDFLLLDEIQNVSNWELWINRLQRSRRRLMVTGSNAYLLSRELATHLTGRHLPIYIFPFSFSEFLKTKRADLLESEIKTFFLDYLEQGGFPEPIVQNKKTAQYVSVLLDSVIYKDIVKRHHIRRVQAIEDLARYLFSNTAREYSYNTLASVTLAKNVHTVKDYLGHLEEAFLLFSVSRFSFKVKNQVSDNKKIYCFDNGFVSAKGFKITVDQGRLLENAVAITLKKNEMENQTELYYWKNQQQDEVDFVIKNGTKIEQLIQVCFDVTNPKTKQREIRALLNASKELKCKNLLILTHETEAVETHEWFETKGKIRFMPTWKWLLKKN